MPDIELMKYVFPDCDIIDDDIEYRAAIPIHTQDIQILDAATAKHKAMKDKNLTALLRFAMWCALEHDAIGMDEDGVAKTLLGVQLEVEEAIKPRLPVGI